VGDAVDQFAEHAFVEEVVIGTIEGHAGNAGFEMKFYELKIGGIAAGGISANLDIAIGNSGTTDLHGFSPSGMAPERMLARGDGSNWAALWRSAQRVCWPKRRGEGVVSGLALEWEEGEERMGGGLHYLDDESWNGFEVR